MMGQMEYSRTKINSYNNTWKLATLVMKLCIKFSGINVFDVVFKPRIAESNKALAKLANIACQDLFVCVSVSLAMDN